MRVLCVDQDAVPKGVYVKPGGIIQNGQSYHVVDVFFLDECIWYELSEDLGHGYWENCFARTSNIDERELAEQRQELVELN